MAINPSSITSKASGLGKAAGWFKPLFVHLKNSAAVLLAFGLLVVLVLLWWLGPKWELDGQYPLEPVLVRSLVTLGLVFLVAATVAIHARYKLKKLAQAEEKAQREQADPVLPFLETMERQFQQTLDELRTSTANRHFLYALPWYMVVGAENSGKTSLINRSNQSFTQSTYTKIKKKRGHVEQLAGFKDTLIEFLSEVLESDRYATAALVRGLYFTSVYQQGIPHNTYVQAAAASFKLPARIEAAKSIQRSVTYFSKSLFQDVIYPEAGLAGDNLRVARSKQRIFALAAKANGLTPLIGALGRMFTLQL